MDESKRGTYGERYTIAFQRHLLACMFNAPGFAVRSAPVIRPEFFESEIHALLATVAQAYWKQHEHPPSYGVASAAVADACRKDDVRDDAIRELKRVYAENVADAPATIALAEAFGKYRALVAAVYEAAHRLDNGKGDTILPVIEEALSVRLLENEGTRYTAATAEQRALWYVADPTDVIPTGLTHLDRLLHGGARRGCLYVVLGPAKRGKTTALINIGCGAVMSLRRLNVLHLTFELLEDVVNQRYDSYFAGRAHKLARTEPEKFAEIVTERVRLYAKGNLFVRYYPTRTFTPSDLRRVLREYAAAGTPIDLLVVDYADIMRPERRTGEMRHEQAGIYEDLREIAGLFNCAVWTASQGNRTSAAKESLEAVDFAEAYEKGAIVDFAMGFSQTRDEKNEGIGRFDVIGSRVCADGGTIMFRINRERCYIATTDYVGPDAERVSERDDEDDIDAVARRAAQAERDERGRQPGRDVPAKKARVRR